MKTILTVLFAMVLTGCGTFDGAEVGRNFAQGFAGASRAQAPVDYGTLQPAKTTDQQCMSTCLSARYQYGLCQSKCSY